MYVKYSTPNLGTYTRDIYSNILLSWFPTDTPAGNRARLFGFQNFMGFVIPLIYFYSSCRSPSLGCRILIPQILLLIVEIIVILIWKVPKNSFFRFVTGMKRNSTRPISSTNVVETVGFVESPPLNQEVILPQTLATNSIGFNRNSVRSFLTLGICALLMIVAVAQPTVLGLVCIFKPDFHC